jgi:hypothetical protein
MLIMNFEGNTEINHVTRNLVTLFDVIDKEIEYLKSATPPSQIDPRQWDKERNNLLNRFEWSKPIVAIGWYFDLLTHNNLVFFLYLT